MALSNQSSKANLFWLDNTITVSLFVVMRTRKWSPNIMKTIKARTTSADQNIKKKVGKPKHDTLFKVKNI